MSAVDVHRARPAGAVIGEGVAVVVHRRAQRGRSARHRLDDIARVDADRARPAGAVVGEGVGTAVDRGAEDHRGTRHRRQGVPGVDVGGSGPTGAVIDERRRRCCPPPHRTCSSHMTPSRARSRDRSRRRGTTSRTHSASRSRPRRRPCRRAWSHTTPRPVRHAPGSTGLGASHVLFRLWMMAFPRSVDGDAELDRRARHRGGDRARVHQGGGGPHARGEGRTVDRGRAEHRSRPRWRPPPRCESADGARRRRPGPLACGPQSVEHGRTPRPADSARHYQRLPGQTVPDATALCPGTRPG